MPLVNAKCTNCGGTLQVDAAKEAAVKALGTGFSGGIFVICTRAPSARALKNRRFTPEVVRNANTSSSRDGW